MVRVYNPLLSNCTNNMPTTDVSGGTVDECLRNLTRQYPALKLFDEKGKLQPYLCIYVNDDIVSPDQTHQPVKESDALSILFMLDGG